VDNSAEKASANVNKLSPASTPVPSVAPMGILAPQVARKLAPDATARSRSHRPQPSRLQSRSPVPAAAPAKTSERTSPQCHPGSPESARGLRIRSNGGRPGAGSKTVGAS
jgi:hypothetical protein